MRRALLPLLPIAFVLLAPPAHSTTCALAPLVFPRPGETAPLNTRVAIRSIGIEPKAIELRGALTGAIVETSVSKRDEGETWYELAPKASLQPSTRYDVVEHIAFDPRPVERFVIGTFVTSTAVDTTPPTWRGALTAEFRVLPRQKVVVIDMFDHRDYVAFKGDGAEDDLTPPDSIRYGVWIEKTPTKAIDYTRPADWVRAQVKFVPDGATKALFTLGSVYICDANAFDIEPLRKKSFKVGVKPVDLAGNYGEAKELVVDLNKSVLAR